MLDDIISFVLVVKIVFLVCESPNPIVLVFCIDVLLLCLFEVYQKSKGVGVISLFINS